MFVPEFLFTLHAPLVIHRSLLLGAAFTEGAVGQELGEDVLLMAALGQA